MHNYRGWYSIIGTFFGDNYAGIPYIMGNFMRILGIYRMSGAPFAGANLACVM